MYRLVKLYFLLLLVLLMGLAFLNLYAPELSRQALETNLRRQLTLSHTLITQEQELREWRRVRWAEFMAQNGALANQLAFATQPQPEPQSSLTLPSEDERRRERTRERNRRTREEEEQLLQVLQLQAAISVAQHKIRKGLNLHDMAELLRRTGASASRETNFTPCALAVVAADGSPVLVQTLADQPLQDFWQGREVVQAMNRRYSTRGMLRIGDSLAYTAVVPILASEREVLGALVIAERMDASSLSQFASSIPTEVTLFDHDGQVLSTTISQSPLLDTVSQHLASSLTENGFPLHSSRIFSPGLTRGEQHLTAMLLGRLPKPSALSDEAAIGFLLALQLTELPSSTIQLLQQHQEFPAWSEEHWKALGFGGGLLLLGLFFFWLDGRKIRRAIKRSAGTSARDLARAESVRQKRVASIYADEAPEHLLRKVTSEPGELASNSSSSSIFGSQAASQASPRVKNGEQPEALLPGPVQPAEQPFKAQTREPRSHSAVFTSSAEPEGLFNPDSGLPESPPSSHMRPEERQHQEDHLSDELLRPIYEKYMASRIQCGQPANIDFGIFRTQLEQNRNLVRQRYDCDRVEFKVGLRQGKAVVMAFPVQKPPQ